MAVASSVLSRVKKKLTHESRFLPHSCLLGTNLHSNPETLDDLNGVGVPDEFYPFSTSFPLPLGYPVPVEKPVINGVDPSLRLVIEKEMFQAKYERGLKRCKVLSSQLPEQISGEMSCGEGNSVHPNLVTLANLISKDPDEYFNNTYNSYYGGTLTISEVNGHTLVVHPVHDPSGKLSIIFPKLGKRMVSTDGPVHYIDHCMGESPLYQVESFSDMLLLRQNKKCGFFKMDVNHNGPSISNIQTTSSKTSYIAACMNKYVQEEWVSLTTDFTVNINKGANNQMSSQSFKVNWANHQDAWGNLHFHDENTLLLCNRSSVNIIDTRQPSDKPSFTYEVSSVAELCEDIYSASRGTSLHYVCTSHNLLSLDLREGWYQKWPHGLPLAPSRLSILPLNAEDLLLVGCQTTGSVTCVHNANSGSFQLEFIKKPPFRLPTLCETLHQSRINGICLSPFVASRFFMSLTGLDSCFVRSKFVDVFMCSSIGDLFTQRISLKATQEISNHFEPFESDRLKEWESACEHQYSNMRSSITATEVGSSFKYINLTSTEPKRALTVDISDMSSDTSIEDGPIKKVDHHAKRTWTMRKHDLGGFSDLLAPKLLACWDLENIDDFSDDSMYADHPCPSPEPSDSSVVSEETNLN